MMQDATPTTGQSYEEIVAQIDQSVGKATVKFSVPEDKIDIDALLAEVADNEASNSKSKTDRASDFVQASIGNRRL